MSISPKLNKEANERFLRGDALSDDDLRNLLNFYDVALHTIEQLGLEYRIVSNSLLSRYRRLQGMQEARREK